jgi:hypothetical protein
LGEQASAYDDDDAEMFESRLDAAAMEYARLCGIPANERNAEVQVLAEASGSSYLAQAQVSAEATADQQPAATGTLPVRVIDVMAVQGLPGQNSVILHTDPNSFLIPVEGDMEVRNTTELLGSSFVCTFPGCSVDAQNGGMVYRTSPKGAPFSGRCPDHLDRVAPPVGTDQADTE